MKHRAVFETAEVTKLFVDYSNAYIIIDKKKSKITIIQYNLTACDVDGKEGGKTFQNQ